LTDYERFVVSDLLRADSPSLFMIAKLYRIASDLMWAERQRALRTYHAARLDPEPAEDGWSARFFTTDSAARLPAWVTL
jgi:hypothetical protein